MWPSQTNMAILSVELEEIRTGGSLSGFMEFVEFIGFIEFIELTQVTQRTQVTQ